MFTGQKPRLESNSQLNLELPGFSAPERERMEPPIMKSLTSWTAQTTQTQEQQKEDYIVRNPTSLKSSKTPTPFDTKEVPQKIIHGFGPFRQEVKVVELSTNQIEQSGQRSKTSGRLGTLNSRRMVSSQTQPQQSPQNQLPQIIILDQQQQQLPEELCNEQFQNQIQRNNEFQSSQPKKLSHIINKSTNDHTYIFKEMAQYHHDTCCFDAIYQDDCCLKKLLDIVFQIIYFPIRMVFIILQKIIQLCCGYCFQKNSCVESFNEKLRKAQNCLYAPFLITGDWINQCWFSCQNFCCCRDLEFLPDVINLVFNGFFMRCCMHIGQFLKNCCTFPIENCKICCANQVGDFVCSTFCRHIGDLFQQCCSPQGFCENSFACLRSYYQRCCDLKCLLQSFCCCCTQVSRINLDGNQRGEVFKCCGCIVESFGDFIGVIVEKLK